MHLIEATHLGSASEKEIVGGKYDVLDVTPAEVVILNKTSISINLEKDYLKCVLIDKIDFY